MSVIDLTLFESRIRCHAVSNAGDSLLLCLECGSEEVTASVQSEVQVQLCIDRMYHTQLQQTWPNVQFCNFNEQFIPDQLIVLNVMPPCAIRCTTCVVDKQAHVQGLSSQTKGSDADGGGGDSSQADGQTEVDSKGSRNVGMQEIPQISGATLGARIEGCLVWKVEKQ